MVNVPPAFKLKDAPVVAVASGVDPPRVMSPVACSDTLVVKALNVVAAIVCAPTAS
jgi:hypothetical protein